ncbi:uncharacterized protein LOC110512379 isoform X1 [Oncorhynchus mykiss]|uniref:Circadian-associated transcriptional repressor-like n=1 Tax=Oncorhynchus mykiss TaxID=8022 RepID=A0A8K9XT50_ONCMY|nr:uncharacterized protein LOC110512379 isoform X1 [Oncorhynchus mykiss]
MRARSPAIRWRMSASDSDYSIDYLASDSEDNDNDSGVGLSPDGHTVRTAPSSSVPPPSSSSLRDSPSNTDCGSSKDGISRLNRNSNHEEPHRLSSDTGDFGDSGLSRDGDSDNSNDADPRLSRDIDCSCGGTPPPATYEGGRCPSETQGCSPTVYGQQQQRLSWSPTASSQAWDRNSRQSGTGKPGQGRKRAHSHGRHPGDQGCRNRDPTEPGEPEKDQLFAQKCMELQRYLHPLSSILRGLCSGRYSERLSRFQESVAMDRIQRIMGVLQNPNMSERYVSVILKMEAMLHCWFPQVRARPDPDPGPDPGPDPDPDPDQHNDSQEEHHTPAKRHKQYQAPAQPPPPASPPVVSPPEGDHHPALRASDGPLPGSFPYSSATHLKRLHTAPICSSNTETETAQQEPPGLGRPSLACSLGSNRPADDQEQTQDDAVSSSTDPQGSTVDPHVQTHPYRVRPRAHRRGPPSGKISSPCLERLLQSKESIISPRNMGGQSPGGGGESIISPRNMGGQSPGGGGESSRS